MGHDRSTFGWFRKFGSLTLTCFFILLVANRIARAQVDEGSITGTVQDSSGAVVAGAQVTLLNTDQGITLQTVTSSSGVYTFSPVRIGHYTLTVMAKGFARTTQENLTVAISQNVMVNVQLKLGAASETVEVTTAPPLMQTEDASVGQVVSSETLNSLPLNGRNFTFLAQLGAGTQTPEADTRGNAASGAFSANGLKPSQNNYLLDGIDNNSNAVDFLNGTNFVILPPLDAIDEFKVQTADFSAELGRSAGAVLNATIKSGSNSLHGAAWEFLRNDKFDAEDWFADHQHIRKGEYRQNQFGATVGAPIIKNKMFIFGDYEGLRRVQGSIQSGISVPTAAERSSGFTDLSDILGTCTSGSTTNPCRTDALGRFVLPGTILDPATTRAVARGTRDPVTGIVAATDGYVRDPFLAATSNCSLSTTNFTGCTGLNQLASTRLDPNAVKLLDLFPAPTGPGVASNFASSPNIFERRSAFDIRYDYNISGKDQLYYRFSWVDDPEYIPGPFGGIADGGGFIQGTQTAVSDQSAMAYTHVFTPNTVNVARLGFNHLHTTRFGPEGSVSGIPAQFGITGIPQQAENGGLPSYSIGGLSQLGSNAFLPSDEVSQTIQITDDFTKIWGKHSFKMGIEAQKVKFSTLQPAFSRGNFDYNGTFTDIPANAGGSSTGKAQFLLTPLAASVANGVDYSGGADSINASDISKTYDLKNYFAVYLQDDWKVGPKLTLNLGVRWDYFGPVQETNGGQANFVPYGGPQGKPEFIIPASGKDVRTLSTGNPITGTPGSQPCAGVGCWGFVDLLAHDGITLESTNAYGLGMVKDQKNNYAPRVGFAYQVSPKLVVRGGFGLFFNAFENQGYSPNLGENYPFVFNFGYGPRAPANANAQLSSVAPISFNTPYAGCATAVNAKGTKTGTATLEAGLSCASFAPGVVNASGLSLEGLQYDYHTPYTMSSNLTFQYSLTRTLSLQAGYVFTDAQHLEVLHNSNLPTQLLPPGGNEATVVPFPDFAYNGSFRTTEGISNYNGLQTKLEDQFSNGLTFLAAYTWSKTLSDSIDDLNWGSLLNFYRASDVPGYGPRADYGLADYDLRHVFHFSGGYQLPFGKDKQLLNQSGKLADEVVGGWSVQWIVTAQGGQPINLTCPTGTATAVTCFVLPTGQSQQNGIHTDTQGQPNWYGNAKAYTQPCPLGVTTLTPGCVLAGNGVNVLGGNVVSTFGPPYRQFDFSAFKAFKFTERYSLQFRSDFFNILNHPSFNAPNFGGNGINGVSNSGNYTSSNFGEIGATRNSPRQIQFALKLYY